MITYTWSFPALDCIPNQSGFANIVKILHWGLIATEPKPSGEIDPESTQSKVYHASYFGTLELDPILDSNSFIPFEELTTGQFVEWVMMEKNITGENGFMVMLANQIEQQKAPILLRKQLM